METSWTWLVISVCLSIGWTGELPLQCSAVHGTKKIMMEMKSEKRSRRFVLVPDGSFGFLFLFLFMYVLKILVGERFGFCFFLSLFLFGSPFEITKAI
ncbi:hypothetical protein LI328DRAFT_14281 [Trichoderma asperelloides]|nr:hypothetical protein LI328DRAFT_14281 [Trichoderma asperelloides]